MPPLLDLRTAHTTPATRLPAGQPPSEQSPFFGFKTPPKKTPTVLTSANGEKTANKMKGNLADLSAGLPQPEAKKEEPKKPELELPPEVSDEMDQGLDRAAIALENDKKKLEDMISLNVEKVAFSDSEAEKANLLSLEQARQRTVEEAKKALDSQNEIAQYNLAAFNAETGGTVGRYSASGAAAIPTIKSNIEEALTEGQRKIDQIDQQYREKIAEAERLMERGQLVEANKSLRSILNIKEEAATEIRKQQADLLKHQEELEAKNRQITIDNNIAKLVQGGVTGASDILGSLKDAGMDVTSKEIEDAVKFMVGDVKNPLEKLSGDAKDFFMLKDMGIEGIGTDLFDYIRRKSAAGRAPEKGTGGGGGGIGGFGGVPGIGEKTNKAIVDALEGMKFPTVDARKRADEAIRQKLLTGDTEGAKNLILQYAKNSFGETTAQVMIGYEQGNRALDNIETGLTELENANIDTSIFAGITQKAVGKLGIADASLIGQQIGDVKLAKIANDIALAIIAYRRAVSGAAFTESEGKSYQDVFPSIGRSKELNSAKIASLRDTFGQGRDSFLSFRINGYDEIFDEESDVEPVKDPLNLGLSDSDPLGLK